MVKLNKTIIKEEIIKLTILQNNVEEFLSVDKYIFDEDLKEFKRENRYKLLTLGFTLNIFLYLDYKKYKKTYYTTKNKLKELIKNVFYHNREYIKKRKEIFKELCEKIEDKELDNEQLDAIVREDRNQLVIAGAGCGKTTTIVGKVKYLVKVLNIKPEEILLLSFTKKSAADMKKRVETEIGQEMECFTFHKLGLDICKEQLSGFSVYEGDMTDFIQVTIKELIKDDDYADKLIYFLTENIYLLKDEFNFSTKEEHKEYLDMNPFITIDGVEVKSFGELEIANYLFINNIKYLYENPYKYATRTNEYKQYEPDFYLPEYDIYIEYFGIDRNGNVPDYFESKHGKSPKEEYNEGIKWKKELHKNNNTKLIDLYYYENKEGILKEKLETQLLKNNVKLNPMTDMEIFNYIEKKNSGIIYNISRSFGTVINLIKSNDYKIDDLMNKARYEKYSDNMLITLELVSPLLDAYDEYITMNRMVDFNDMINMATDACNSGGYVHNYKYVIVDEFQDISLSRYKLLKAMREVSDYKLYCVGDDFQSIFRFSGSDIGIFTNFEKYFGRAQINKIEKTHRFSDYLAKISGDFIMKNPNQIKKNLQGYYSGKFPLSRIQGYTSKVALNFIKERLNYLEENANILFLGRYNYDNKIIIEDNDFEVKKEKIIYKERKDLNIKFLTIHKSKGLEADYVVLLNTRKKYLGFPSNIMDLPVMKLMLDNSDNYPYSEERRLFYVAITRARKKVFFIVEENNRSQFFNELEYKYSYEFSQERFECPICGENLKFIKLEDKKIIKCKNDNCKYERIIKKDNEQLALFK